MLVNKQKVKLLGVYCTENIRVFITLSRKLILIFKPLLPKQILVSEIIPSNKALIMILIMIF